jgi:phosphoglycolate phosphatase
MNILFDLDGTLADPFEGITKCISYALEKLGMPAPERQDLRWAIGPPLRDCFANLLASDDAQLIERAVSVFRERFASIGLFENEVYVGIPEALDGLCKMGHTLYVATSKPTIYAVRIIDHFGMRNYFRSVCGCELDGTRTDKQILLAHLLESQSLASTNTLMIGDRQHDMIAAGANGVTAIGVLWGYGSREELEAAGASTCVTHPRELASKVSHTPRA